MVLLFWCYSKSIMWRQIISPLRLCCKTRIHAWCARRRHSFNKNLQHDDVLSIVSKAQSFLLHSWHTNHTVQVWMMSCLGYVEESRFGDPGTLEFSSEGVCSRSQCRLLLTMSCSQSRLVSSRQLERDDIVSKRRHCEHEKRDYENNCSQCRVSCSQFRLVLTMSSRLLTI